MSIDLFEKNAYTVLGVSFDVPASALQKAFNEAQRARRAKQQELATAMQDLRQLGSRLALDALLLAPEVPESRLRDMVARLEEAAPPSRAEGRDLVQSLVLVPEFQVDLPRASDPSPPRAIHAEAPILEPEIEP